jgi:hypothetical protein
MDFKTINVGWGCSSVIEHLLILCKALSSIPSIERKRLQSHSWEAVNLKTKAKVMESGRYGLSCPRFLFLHGWLSHPFLLSLCGHICKMGRAVATVSHRTVNRVEGWKRLVQYTWQWACVSCKSANADDGEERLVVMDGDGVNDEGSGGGAAVPQPS